MRTFTSLLVLLAAGCGGVTIPPNDAGVTPEDGGSVDGGVDAGPGDAGPDAGPFDGGLDASFPDAGLPCATMPFATPCAETATTPLPSGSPGTTGAFQVSVETLANPRPSAPGAVTVYRPTGQTQVPVLFFAHAFGATNPASYLGLFQMLASNGYAVVHVPYPLLPAGQTKNAERYACLWAGFTAAATQYASTFDLTRVGFFGHSFGGGATPEMARLGFVGQGWGSAGRLMFIMAPWYSWGSGYDTLPSNVRTVIQVYADDDTNDHQIAVNDIWNKLPANLERSWQMIRTDVCQCGLNATHTLPMTQNTLTSNPENVLNGADAWGVFRRIHALARYAFANDASTRDIAFGADANMGAFPACGGRAVRPLESAAAPVTAACASFMYPASARCASADPGFVCP